MDGLLKFAILLVLSTCFYFSVWRSCHIIRHICRQLWIQIFFTQINISHENLISSKISFTTFRFMFLRILCFGKTLRATISYLLRNWKSFGNFKLKKQRENFCDVWTLLAYTFCNFLRCFLGKRLKMQKNSFDTGLQLEDFCEKLFWMVWDSLIVN